MNIINCCFFTKSEKDFYFKKVLNKLKTFYDDKDGIYEEFHEYRLIFDKTHKLVGILKLDVNLRDVDIKLVEVFKKGYGTKIVNYIKQLYQDDYDIYASKVKRTSIGFWLKMGFKKIKDETHFKFLKEDDIYDGYYTLNTNHRKYLNTNDIYNIVIDDSLKMYYFTNRYYSLINLKDEIILKYSIYNFNETRTISLYKYDEEPWLRKRNEKKYLEKLLIEKDNIKDYQRIDNTTEIEINYYTYKN